MDEFAGIANNQYQQAGNYIGDGGARALSEALKTNTTLQSLNIGCEQEESEEDELETLPTTNKSSDNGIGDEGARALSDALKTNTTLTALNLGREQEENEEDGSIADIDNKH